MVCFGAWILITDAVQVDEMFEDAELWGCVMQEYSARGGTLSVGMVGSGVAVVGTSPEIEYTLVKN